MDFKEKNKQLVAYLVKNNPKSSITVLMKLCYLIDLYCLGKSKDAVSGFHYVRYYYGPFDNEINSSISDLVSSSVITPSVDFTSSGNEYVVYNFNDDADFGFDLIKENIEDIDIVLENLKGYGAKTLTEIAYKTKPMLKINATLGGDEHLNEALDMNA